MTSTDENTAHKRPRLSLFPRYDSLSRDWVSSSIVKDLELCRRHEFENSHSLSGVVIKPGLIEASVDKWDIKIRVFTFCSVKIYRTIRSMPG